MFDFGDELIFGTQKIPWLVWIQLLVLLLLIILLYYITIFALGLDPSPTGATASPSTPLLSSNSGAAASTSRLHNTKVGEVSTIIKDDTSGTSTRRRRVRREEIQEREGGSYHPCHYFGLAGQAFLRCLGFDPASKDSSNSRQRKEE